VIRPILLVSLAPSLLVAQHRTGPRPLLDRAAEIALAKSAAPAAISDRARVWILTDRGYQIADSGKGPVNCYVGRPWVESVEPHCLDAEGSATILPIQIRRVELYIAGKSFEEAEREIASGIAAGKFRLPTRPAVTYMMSAAQDLITETGNSVGSWQPHLMIYFPNLPDEGTGLSGFVPGVGFVENPGTPFSALIVPLATFVPAPSGRR
jgi:hypothetical protein